MTRISLTRGAGMPRVARSTAPCACCSLGEGSAAAAPCISPASAAPPPSMAIFSSARRPGVFSLLLMIAPLQLLGGRIPLDVVVHELEPESLWIRHEHGSHRGADERRVIGPAQRVGIDGMDPRDDG